MKFKLIVLFCLISTLIIASEAAKHTKRRRSTTPPTPTTTTRAPKCATNQSPAEECFDYFILTVSWTPGYAYKVEVKKDDLRKNIVDNPKWIIHGLWPSMVDKSHVTPRCKRTDIFFNDNRPGFLRIKSALDETWHSLRRSKPSRDFWDHEFKEHGSCATRSTVIKDDITYFTKTLGLFNGLKIRSTLSRNEYNPGRVRKLKDVMAIMKQINQKEVIVNAVWNPKTNQNYLAEVYFCYNTNLTPIDCPNKVTSKKVLERDVLYLDNYVL